jgi:ring-1,2-phenylacetyl-CoA epoxidase subunit PaaC
MENKINYYLQIADNAYILSHRLSEYSSKGPFLEEDLANTNVALDLIGLAEAIYEETAKLSGENILADFFPHKRSEKDFRNCILVEQPNHNFAEIMVRQCFMDTFHYHFFQALINSKDNFLASIALKTIKEVKYHKRRSSEWIIRFGNSTDEAKQKVEDGISNLWKFTAELFEESEIDLIAKQEKIGVDLIEVKSNWERDVQQILKQANLNSPATVFKVTGGKNGLHSEYLGYMLSEIQFLNHKYPEAIW